MTKSELRHARKAARKSGQKLLGELAIVQNHIGSNRTHRRAAARKRAETRAIEGKAFKSL